MSKVNKDYEESNEYKHIKGFIRTGNKELLEFISKDEIVWLKKHFKFIHKLLMGRIKTKEKKYIQFVNNIQNKKAPQSKEEKIYLQFIKYFQSEINNSKVDLKDENILHNGIEIYPEGNRPYGEGINNRDRERDDDYW